MSTIPVVNRPGTYHTPKTAAYLVQRGEAIWANRRRTCIRIVVEPMGYDTIRRRMTQTEIEHIPVLRSRLLMTETRKPAAPDFDERAEFVEAKRQEFRAARSVSRVVRARRSA